MYELHNRNVSIGLIVVRAHVTTFCILSAFVQGQPQK